VVGILRTLALGALAFALLLLLALGPALMIAIQPHADRQGPDLRRRPGGIGEDQREDDPVVPPTDPGALLAGEQRVVVHAGAEDGQAALAAVAVVDARDDGPLGVEVLDGLDRQGVVEVVDRPGSVAEEAVVP